MKKFFAYQLADGSRKIQHYTVIQYIYAIALGHHKHVTMPYDAKDWTEANILGAFALDIMVRVKAKLQSKNHH